MGTCFLDIFGSSLYRVISLVAYVNRYRSSEEIYKNMQTRPPQSWEILMTSAVAAGGAAFPQSWVLAAQPAALGAAWRAPAGCDHCQAGSWPLELLIGFFENQHFTCW